MIQEDIRVRSCTICQCKHQRCERSSVDVRYAAFVNDVCPTFVPLLRLVHMLQRVVTIRTCMWWKTVNSSFSSFSSSRSLFIASLRLLLCLFVCLYSLCSDMLTKRSHHLWNEKAGCSCFFSGFHSASGILFCVLRPLPFFKLLLSFSHSIFQFSL